jgi:predicted transposase/invertase (TIGR01784 family)
MRPVFADPKTDFVFKRIFGTEQHKSLLIALLNALLELDDAHRIVDLSYLAPEQRVPVDGLKLSILDVKCTDAGGARYVVEMQVLNVDGFEKRVVYNAAKAYVLQLRTGNDYPELCDVVGLTICDFTLWPGEDGQPAVPMLSRWRMQEQHAGRRGMGQLRFTFLELPKYTAGDQPVTLVEKWAYFFREAKDLDVVPSALDEAPFRDAFEAARMATFDVWEWEAYDREKIAEQDARGALTLARRLAHREGLREGRREGLREGLREGREEGLADGLRQAVGDLCELLGIELSAERRAALRAMDMGELTALRDRLKRERRWD